MTSSNLAFDNVSFFPVQAEAAAEAAAEEAAAAAAAAARYTLPTVSWDAIQSEWCALFGGKAIPVPILQWLKRIIDDGTEPELIVRAIQDTAWARSPSPAYFRGILNRCIRTGIKSVMDYDRHEAERDIALQRRSKSNDTRWI